MCCVKISLFSVSNVQFPTTDRLIWLQKGKILPCNITHTFTTHNGSLSSIILEAVNMLYLYLKTGKTNWCGYTSNQALLEKT